MTPERYQKYLHLLQEFLSPDLTERILADKQAEVIVEIGDALAKTREELETTKADLRVAEGKVFAAKAKSAKGKKTSKAKVKTNTFFGAIPVVSRKLKVTKLGIEDLAVQTPVQSPLLVP